MDLRKEKTIQRIKDGFKELIQKRDYSSITIQDILDTSYIGRTTFYMHYKSKDEVLKSIVDDIFIHVLNPKIEQTHSFGDESFLAIINHTLLHFKEDKDLLKAILKGESNDIFLNRLRLHLDSLISERMMPYYKAENIREDVLLNHLSSSLLEIIIWWISKNDCKEDPLTISYDYFSLVMPALETKDFTYKMVDNLIKIK
jgi:AcrR family transcriptional regulator